MLLLLPVSLFAQGPVKFGKISKAEVSRTSYLIDTAAAAVIIADIGKTEVVANKKDFFSLEFKHHKRIHILQKSGYDYATIEIPLYKDGDMEEELKDLKAITYNFEDGKIVETELNVKSGVFKEKLNNNIVIKKFTLPNVKEGSVIEYEYKIISDFLYNLQPWYFQEEIPCLWSEYTVGIPQFLNYRLISQGNHPMALHERKDKTGFYSVQQTLHNSYGSSTSTERINITCGLSDFRWAMKDIPAMKEESFTSTLKNYRAKLEFQLAEYAKPLTEQKLITTWPDFTQRLMKDEDFGNAMIIPGNWLANAIAPIIGNASSEKEKATKLFTFVRDNFTCTDLHQVRTEKPLRVIFESKNGGVAEINLLLTSMLRTAGVRADPVLLSRRKYGFVYADYPLMNRFNYVVCRAFVDDRFVMLDGANNWNAFDRLPYDCYNGIAKVVNNDATTISLLADQIAEKQQIDVVMKLGEKGQWSGSVKKQYGYFGSMDLRKEIRADKTGFENGLSKAFDSEVKLNNLSTAYLDKLEEPVIVSYDFSYIGEEADIIYMSPILIDRQKQNPFKSADRRYPVEMPYLWNETYSALITLPENYNLDEVPSSLALKLNAEGDVKFDYKVSQVAANTIKVQSRLEINKALFSVGEYEALREFFNRVVAKQNEQVVLKKAK
jgi:hypothetical protein